MSGKPKKRSVLGLFITSLDGLVWTWALDGVVYNWCAHGQLRTREGEVDRLVMFCEKVEGAVGYSMGLHDGLGRSKRGCAALLAGG